MRPSRTSSVRAVFSLTFVLLLVGLGVGGGPVLAWTNSSGPASVPAVPTVAVQLGDNGRNIDVPAGNLLVLVLPANPSTGYGWQLDGASATMLNAAQPEFQIEDGGQTSAALAGGSLVVGAPQIETLRFSALRAGQTALRLAYRRPWEQSTPTQTFNIMVTSHGAGATLPAAGVPAGGSRKPGGARERVCRGSSVTVSPQLVR